MKPAFLSQCSQAAVLGLLSAWAVAALADDQVVSFTPDGKATIENSLLSLSVGNRVGEDGLLRWFFKPTGHEMVDVYYGLPGYKGHAFSEVWDGVQLAGLQGGGPDSGGYLLPVQYGVAGDGSGVKLVQQAERTWRYRKSYVLRRDSAVLECVFHLENVAGTDTPIALRLHNTVCPGHRGEHPFTEHVMHIETEEGPLAVVQNLKLGKHLQKYKNDCYFLPLKGEPNRHFTTSNPPTPKLRGPWMAQVHPETGDGMLFYVPKDDLAGIYNCPQITVEPIFRAKIVKRGQEWTVRMFLGAFTGAAGKTIADATPLYVATEKPGLKDGQFAASLIPMFRGTIRLLDGKGATVVQETASPTGIVTLKGKIEGEAWSLAAFDTHGAQIGLVSHDGKWTLSDPKVPERVVRKPRVAGSFCLPDAMKEKAAAFLADRDFTVKCDWKASEAERELAQRLARRFGVGLCYNNPRDPAAKMLLVGNATGSEVVRDAGMMTETVSADWPGAGKGAILAFENYAITQKPLLLVAGSDREGTVKAGEVFWKRFAEKVEEPKGFDFWVAGTDLKVFPYTMRPKSAPEKAVVEAARGEYEPAQFVITAKEELRDVEVKVTPLLDGKGKEIDRKYLTTLRRLWGPLWVRWVNTFPLDPEDGFSGIPDPLLVRPETTIPAGRSQALWLTAIISEDAAPGTYTSSITCKANGVEKSLPIEVRVWDFVLPRTALKGDPYMAIQTLVPSHGGELTATMIHALVSDFVEHHQRCIHIGFSEAVRWHFSPDGAFKSLKHDSFTVSEDGKVAMETSYLDWFVAECDKAAKPFDLDFMVYCHVLLNGQADFAKALPDRFAGKAKREGHWYQNYYAEEMFTLFKAWLVKRGWEKRFTVKISDEPAGFDAWYDAFTLGARNAGLRIMTAFNNIDWQEAERGLGMGLWEPLYQNHSPEFFKKAKAAGDQVSWYNCGPPPASNIWTPAAELRSYMWQAAKAELDSLARWGIQCWSTHHNEWHFYYSHHDHVVYPSHPEKPAWMMPGKGWVDHVVVDGVRWELMRDGFEDAAYVYLLRDRIKAAREAGLKEAADKAQAALDSIWQEVFRTLNDYNPPYERILESRRKVASAILELQPALAKATAQPAVPGPAK